MGKQDLIVKQQGVLSSNPSAPPAGYAIIFPKSDGNWYTIDASGNVIQVTLTNTITIGKALAMQKGFARP